MNKGNECVRFEDFVLHYSHLRDRFVTQSNDMPTITYRNVCSLLLKGSGASEAIEY